MTHQLFHLPKSTQIDSSVRVTPGAKAYFYATTTSTPQDTYTTSALSVAHPNPVVADANGVFPAIYLDPALAYKLTLNTSADALIYTVDPANDQILSRVVLGRLLYPQTAEELAAGLTPTNYYYEPQDIRRYGADATGATDSVPAIHAGWTAYNHLNALEGTYKIAQTITPTGNKTLSGHDGGTPSSQAVILNHTGSGPLWQSTSNEFGGVCLQNFYIIGGNGGYAIENARPQSTFRNLHMETYAGSGISLTDGGNGTTAPGSWGCNVENLKWVAPASQTAYRGANVSVNGGNVEFKRCVFIRGSIGINVDQCEALLIKGCSFNNQNGTYSSEAISAGQCGVRLTGLWAAGPPIVRYKQAFEISGGNYFESCSNNLWIDEVQSLLVTGNYFDDNACGGPNITIGANGNNVSIHNNHMLFRYAGGVVNNILNNGTNTVVEDNDIELSDTTAPAANWLETTTACLYGNNRVIDSARVPITYKGVLDTSNLAIDTKPVRSSFTGTLTGCTTSPTATFTYTISNGMVTMLVPSLTAVSNTTACTVTGVPAEIMPLTLKRMVCRIVDNSVTAFGMVQLDPGTSGTLTLGVGATFAAFTNVNNKGTSNTELSWGLE